MANYTKKNRINCIARKKIIKTGNCWHMKAVNIQNINIIVHVVKLHTMLDFKELAI